MRRMVACALLLLIGTAWGQTFRWQDVEQRVLIQADGSVIVEDTRTLTVSGGDFGEAFICVRLRSGESLELLSGSGVVNAPVSGEALEQSCSGGREVFVRFDERIRSSARVHFRYRLSNTLDYGNDVVQWYWNIVGEEHPRMDNYRLEVIAPGGHEDTAAAPGAPSSMSEPYDAYVMRYTNPEEPRVSLSSDRLRLNVNFDRIPPDTGLEIRYLMDPRLFEASLTEGQPARLEQFLRDQAETSRVLVLQHSIYTGLVGIVLALALFVGIGYSFFQVGRDPDIPSMQYPFEPPSDIPPATVKALLAKNFSSGTAMDSAFSATVMDLARRGYGVFHSKEGGFFSQSQVEMDLDLEKSEEGLEGFEREVLHFLKKAAASAGRQDYLEFSSLKKYSQKHMSKFRSSWDVRVRAWIEAYWGGKLITPESRQAMQQWSLAALLALALCVGAAFYTFGPAQIMFASAAALCFLALIAANTLLPAWREEVAAEVYGWQGFKRTLSDYTQMKDAPNDFFILWDRYFCYAAALGVAEKFLKNVEQAVAARNLDQSSLTRQAYWMGVSSSNFSSNMADFQGMTRSVSTLNSALQASSSSASSGGSSSGGGGGGGGGSSGGR